MTLDILIASDDRTFLRLAGAVLGNDGHRTTRSVVSAARIERTVRLRRPDVLVLDAQEDQLVVAAVCSRLLTSRIPVALVLVCEEDQLPEDGRSGDLPVVARWGAPESLLQAVREAVAGAPVPPSPRPLRLVDR